MDKLDIKGTFAEQLAAIGKVNDFFHAIAADNIAQATQLMKRAGINAPPLPLFFRRHEVKPTALGMKPIHGGQHG